MNLICIQRSNVVLSIFLLMYTKCRNGEVFLDIIFTIRYDTPMHILIMITYWKFPFTTKTVYLFRKCFKEHVYYQNVICNVTCPRISWPLRQSSGDDIALTRGISVTIQNSRPPPEIVLSLTWRFIQSKLYEYKLSPA